MSQKAAAIMDYTHLPVMPNECLKYLNCVPGSIIADGTLGGGGHSELILRQTAPDGKVIGIDLDDYALEKARQRLAGFGDRLITVKGNYSQIRSILETLGMEKLDGALMDLGASSFQFDDPLRGFSYQKDAPLDMRMDITQPLDARTVVNTYSQEALSKIIFEYGEERFARSIAGSITRARSVKPIETTGELAEIIKMAIPAPARRNGPHPAKRTFQAIRIEVNCELEHLRKALEEMTNALRPGGRLVVITFHSLEDRIVKRAFQIMEKPCTCPPKAPVCICGKKAVARILTKKPVLPSQEETEQNPRSRSAKMRAIEMI
jgi:16S rRNA (cytosine1402-N4)-methyltransferase